MILSIIVAVAENSVIGREGSLPWHLPAEMAYFRKTTSRHPVIMGRKTHEDVGRALPNRLNVVITRDKDYKAAKGCVVVHSLKEALELAEIKSADEVFVLGGQSIFEQALPITDKLYLTKVRANVEGDTYFHYDSNDWQQTWSEKHAADADNQYAFEFTVLQRKRPVVR